ncbi:hemerythrin domain-containing protein [Uliginosibacterium sp. H3]|uniref:Hemerythrin domain-containing protein n=1 Tax=Uliginosibacterium silvisoli TaxID=3114758 RepID=A0ABU6K5S7_9RHOO|nr:hemerythrin domain-containing protein [Uliginosibacterium sp. H3]
MKRHASLIKLSREHHAGLVLSKRISVCASDVASQTSMSHTVLQSLANELLPHFEEEERDILPILQGRYDAERTRALQDHDSLLRLASRIAGGDASALTEFGQILSAHIRFEERELFPLYESLITTKGTP